MILNVIRRQNSKLFVVVDIPSRISYNSITSMIKVIRMINSENFDIPFRSIVILLFTVLLSSCLKETAVPIKSAFSIESSEDKALSVVIQPKHLKLLRMRVKVILDEVALQLYIISPGKKYNFMR